MIKKGRIPILALAMLCLLSGLWSGLSRIGWGIWSLPVTAHHGAIMVPGFLGTLIALEKIIPLKRNILYIIPAWNALGIIFFFTDQPRLAVYSLVGSGVALLCVFLYYLQQHRNTIYALMSIGASCLVTGNVLLLTKQFYPLAFPWWAAFALFIIAAERLELMTFLPVSKTSKKIVVALLVSFVIGVLMSFHGTGNIICGGALIGGSLWLMRNDVIGINIKKKELPAYVATSLLMGYVALLLCGIFFIVLSDQWLNYDIIVHSFFIGFIFSMIFAHGPVILPGVMGISAKPFSRILYVWLYLLHGSWIIRVVADITLNMPARKISGVLSAIAIVGYFITMAALTIKSQRHGQTR